jgi:Ala-tRNA(Pro) deacylase
LFLCDKKKVMYLVVAANETKVDLKSLETKLGAGRFSFGSPDRLWKYLGIFPGAVCPFTVINDKNHDVQVVLDAYMMKVDTVCYHPLDNAQTIGLSPADLLKFFAHTGHTPKILDL